MWRFLSWRRANASPEPGPDLQSRLAGTSCLGTVAVRVDPTHAAVWDGRCRSRDDVDAQAQRRRQPPPQLPSGHQRKGPPRAGRAGTTEESRPYDDASTRSGLRSAEPVAGGADDALSLGVDPLSGVWVVDEFRELAD